MLIVIHREQHEEFPERCPLVHRNQHHSYICGHPDMDLGRQSLYCNYVNCVDEFVAAPSRCPLIHSPLEGLRVEASK